MAEKFNVPFIGSLPLNPNLFVDNLVKALPITENSIIEDIRDVKFASLPQSARHEDVINLS